MTPEIILSFDFGTRRIGVASGDTLTRTARGLKTFERAGDIPWAAIGALVAEYRPGRLVIGVPYNMDGTPTLLTDSSRAFARELRARFGLPACLMDERLSSREAQAELRDARASGLKRRRLTHADVDMTAAKIVLERWFDNPAAAEPLEPQQAHRGRSLSTESTNASPSAASTAPQRDGEGRLRHLITLEGLSRDELTALLDLAQFYVRSPGSLPARDQSLAGHTVANLFFEPSTRTRVSFELAALRLGADVVNLDMQSSSRVKGETVLDTIYTLQAMLADILIMRDAEPGLPAYVAKHVAPHVCILNAGEAHLSHPTQGLLDALTVRQMKHDFQGLRVLIAGDIAHSRVARSAWQAFTTLGVEELRIAAPADLMPRPEEFATATRFDDIDRAIEGVDVVMALRIQRERFTKAQIPDEATYHRTFGITAERLRKAQPDAIVMHPGPMNRGVEISAEVADGPQSVIQQQVMNGVAVRMAVLATIARNVQERRRLS